MERKRKHFNKATVYGSLLQAPDLKYTPNGKGYLSLQLQCPNDLHGNVRVYGKLWGDNLEPLLQQMTPGNKIRMEGVLQQYEREDDQKIITNFNFFSWRPCVKKEEGELRAVFVLVVEVNEVAAVSSVEGGPIDEWELLVMFEQEATDKRQARSELLLLHAEKSIFGSIDPENLQGALVQISGVLEQPEDYFGNTTKATRPMIKEMKVVSALIQEKGAAGMEGGAEVPF